MIALTAWRHSILFKGALLLVLLLLLCIPLAQIAQLIAQRGHGQQDAERELARTHVGAQTLAGPVLVVPYVEHWQVVLRNEQGERTGTQARSAQRVQLVFPEQLDLQGTLTPQERYRGIFTVLFYKLAGRISGQFAPFDPAVLLRHEPDSRVEVQPPVLALGVSDLRGLEGAPRLSLAGEAPAFAQRVPHLAEGNALAAGMHAPLAGQALAAFQAGQALPFALDITLMGQRDLAVLPLGDETTAQLQSPWPHPSFGGRFLAAERTVTDSGFDARWHISALTTQAREQVRAGTLGAGRAQGALREADAFEVSFVQPVNVYSMSERAAKYGALFIALVLMAVFMVELFKRLALHPVQYALVGLSIAVFFLLLVALSEKIGFALAYAGAAGASALLLAVYFSAVLGSARRGASLAAYVGLLYGALYALLASESNALLLGALLVFAMLAALMLATRHVDWSRLGGGTERADAPAA
ncbi:MAG: cell envelope integrity protein CreD [Pseudomonadota bacterium]|nr:cell envelope integrity protein CreD [Pseudomonadota bacterium]